MVRTRRMKKVVAKHRLLLSKRSSRMVSRGGALKASQSPHVSSRRKRSEKPGICGDQGVGWGSWRCVCGTLCTTSSLFFLHSRNCQLTYGSNSDNDGAVSFGAGVTTQPRRENNTRRDVDRDGAVTVASCSRLPTLREEMLFSLNAAVASGELHGDCLSAAVSSLQRAAAEERAEGKAIGGRKEAGRTLLSTSWRLPSTFLPVSGSALRSAAERCLRNGCDESGENDDLFSSLFGEGTVEILESNSTDYGRGNAGMNKSPSHYYTVLPNGLEYAKKISIGNTYSFRAAFAEVSQNITDKSTGKNIQLSDADVSGGLSVGGSGYDIPDSATGTVDPYVNLRRAPMLQFNTAHAGMSLHVYKRFLSRDEKRSERRCKAGAVEVGNASTVGEGDVGDEVCMDAVLRREESRIPRVPMPVVEWHYPK